MPEKKQETFTVTDRRQFTHEGEVREDASPETVPVATVAEAPQAPAPAEVSDPPMPAPPTDAEQRQQADAYQASSRDLDRRIESGGHSAKDLEMTFERFMASLYMTAMMQLGMMHEEGGQPRLDPIGARQTIDTLNLIADKTKGNLTSAEQTFLQNCLYELRMAYVEVINALSRAPQSPSSPGGKPGVAKPDFGKPDFTKR